MTDFNRVFITGLSALTACGETLDNTWNALSNGQTGIDEIKQWDLSSWTHRLGGELKNFKPAAMLPDRKLVKMVSRQDIMGINAAIQAITHSNMLPFRDTLASADSFNDQTAIYVGSPGSKYFQQYDFLPLLAKTKRDMKQFGSQLLNEVHPMWLLRILPNNVLAYAGITYGFKGSNHNIVNHAVSGMQALIEAYYAIQQGLAERVIVVAYDIGLEPQALFYYEKLGILSARHLKPFDKDHDGTILAEGASAIVLESESSARARSARCYGEVVGGGSASEGTGLFSIESEGDSLAALLAQVLERAELSSTDIGFLVAHGNGNKKSDESEAKAITKVFGDYSVPVTAFKWSTGHTITASGLLDAVLAAYALNKKCIPGIANLNQPSSVCQHLNISAQHRPVKEEACTMVINRGFASMNACIVIKDCA